MRTEKRSSPQISGDMVSLHNMASPQNGNIRGGPPPDPPPPSDATASETDFCAGMDSNYDLMHLLKHLFKGVIC